MTTFNDLRVRPEHAWHAATCIKRYGATSDIMCPCEKHEMRLRLVKQDAILGWILTPLACALLWYILAY